MTRPAVSVVIPYRDAAPWLGETLRSVARQTFKSWELLLIDNGSKDRGPRIASDFAASLPGRVRCLRHPGGADRGPFGSRMLGAAKARAGVIALLDADDLWQPRYLERHLAYWKTTGAALSYGPARYWFPGQPALDFVHAMPAPGRKVFGAGALLQNFLSSGYGTVPRTGCALLRRDRMLELAPFAAAARRFPRFEDQFLMWGMAARWPVAIHPGAWMRYRQRTALEDRPRAFYAETLRDEVGFLPIFRIFLARLSPSHPLLEPSGIPARLAALRRPGRRTPFGDYFFERVPADLRALANL